ncbi:cation:proton antiporter [Croceimicrobium sp.]|uniref:cation:proton antiporter n=1 Tax=Croceimicrobium sp. TaxID=2828340 RepID=UPI003BABA03C
MEGMAELASILILSVFAQWMAWKIKIPAILPLIIIGLALGPGSTFFTSNGEKILDGDHIFSGDLLFAFVSISVGVILFEGGLTLKLREIRHQAGVVRNLLFFGPIITLAGGGFAAHYLMGMDYTLSFLFGALIIVSGPTVVTPILRNVRPNIRINNVLKWEGILIDPLGALIAVLVYEFIQTSDFTSPSTTGVFKEFFLTVASGMFVGGLAAFFLRWLLQKNRIPSYLRNVMALGMVIFAFTFAEFLAHEAGLMSTTFMGIILANVKVQELKKILSFKEDVSIILISVLFILLSSRIHVEQIEKLGLNALILFGIVILILRPLAVWLSTRNSGFNWREVVFMSWVGPKGIVAAAVASLFALQLTSGERADVNVAQAELILPLTFLMIVGTVILQGATAKPFARLLKVEREEPRGFLIAGANENSRFLAQFLQNQGVDVILADTSKTNQQEARRMGFEVFEGSILSDNVYEELDLNNIGILMAMTSSAEINGLALKYFDEEFGPNKTFRLCSKKEQELPEIDHPPCVLFGGRVDYLNLAQSVRQAKQMTLRECNNMEDYEKICKEYHSQIIPMFRIHKENLEVIARDLPDFSKGDQLAFIPLHNARSSSKDA